MEYIQGIASQTRLFLFAVGFGFILGILYDVFRTLRMIISGSKIFVIFMDILYFAVCGFLIFCFSLVIDYGRIRMFSLAGNALGWLIYYFSFGAIAIKVTSLVSGFAYKLKKHVRQAIKFLWRKLKKIIKIKRKKPRK